MTQFDIVQYNPSIHQVQLEEWYIQHQINLDLIDLLPKFGLIIPNICAIFLYKCDKVFFIESLISNRNSLKHIRDEALDQLVDAMIQYCKTEGCQYLFGVSIHKSVINRASKHDFNIDSGQYKAFSIRFQGDN